MRSVSGKRILWTSVAVAIVVVSGLIVSLITQGRPRDLARVDRPDGTARVIVAKPRLFGLLGVEIVQEDCTPEGRRHSGFVQDLRNSMEEARQTYENPEGGRLLTPLQAD